MTTYSAFFSSGLLAPHHAYFTTASSAFPRTPTKPRGESFFLAPGTMTTTPSPARPSSPMPIPDDSDVEFGLDMDVDQRDKDRDNDATPTQTHRGTLTSSSNILLTKQQLQAQPRLRKRRSSITLAASPMNAIRSPARTAGAALQLQRHLPPPPGGLGARSRSGSLVQAGELEPDVRVGGNDMRNVACESTSLLGRMRSGSVGGLLRPRRGVRKLAARGIPAAVPPPTAPLPALPVLPQAGQRMAFAPAPQAQVQVVPLKAKPRARGLSVVQSERIDEEMKEN